MTIPMKTNGIISLMLLAGSAAAMFTACDDKESLLTLNAKDVKLMEEITFEVSDVLKLGLGMDSTLVYSFGPQGLEDHTIVFTSSDPSIATVDQNGKITAVGLGDAVITALPSIGFKTYDAEASVLVQVIPQVVKATSINITNTTPTGDDGTIFVTDELQLAAEILPADHTYDNISWHSENDAIASVDQNGLVKCNGEGTVKIYALAHDHGTGRGEIELTIKPYVTAESLTIAPLAEPVCLTRGAFDLNLQFTPANATMGSIEWTTSDPTIATVHRGTVTPVGFGTAVITGKCVASGFEAAVTVTVDPGWYIWDAQNQWKGWETADTNAPDTRTSTVWHIEFPNPTAKTGRNIKVSGLSNNGPFFSIMPNNYPVLAVRIKRPNGGVSKLDDALASGQSVTRTKELNAGGGIDLGDGTRLLIYNIGANYTPAADELKFRVFQFKYTDFTGLTEETAFYDIYWIRTFKSEDDAKDFAQREVAQ